MEISLREWLIIGGVIVIALILFDGWRRIRASRNRLKIDIDKSLSELGDANHHNPELPNGGARLRQYDSEPFFADTPVTDSPPDSVEASWKPQQEVEPDISIQTAEKASSPLESVESFEPDTSAVAPKPVSEEETINPVDLQDAMASMDEPLSPDESLSSSKPQGDSLQDSFEDEDAGVDDTQHEKPSLESNLEDAAVTQDKTDEPDVAITEDKIDTEESLEWDPALEKQFEDYDQPSKSNASFADLDPLFDEIPTDSMPPKNIQSDPVKKTAPEKNLASEDEPNLFLDLDLDQPIHQLMVNKAAENKVNREVTRRNKTKPTSEESNLSLPLEPEDDPRRHVASQDIDPPLSDLFAETDAQEDPLLFASNNDPLGPSLSDTEDAHEASTPDSPSNDIKSVTEAKQRDSDNSKAAATAARKALSDLPDPEEVLVITVVGKNRQRLDGLKLQRVVEACGMEHGDMSIYHRFEGEGNRSSLQFSMANAVNPGTFDPATMDQLETPAVSFFMSMREPSDAMTAYECMLATAETLAKHLDGDLLDEDRSVMREQTKEHYRQRIRDFEMQARRRNLIR